MSHKKIIKLIDQNNYKKVLESIKKNKLNPTENIIDGNNIIHIASSNNIHSIISHISSTNPSALKIHNNDGQTPLHIMAKRGYNTILKKVLKDNPDLINTLNSKDETVFHSMVKSDIDSIIDHSINKLNINYNQASKTNSTALSMNTSKSKKKNDKYHKRIKKILSSNSNVNTNEPIEYPPIFNAIKHNGIHIVETLLKNKANVNHLASNYISPLIYSIDKQRDNITKLLLDNKADVNYGGPEGDLIPLSFALSIYPNSNIISEIIKHNPDVKKYDRNLNTPLHIAFGTKTNKKLNKSTMMYLISNGDMNQQNINGETPLKLLTNNPIYKLEDYISKKDFQKDFQKEFQKDSYLNSEDTYSHLTNDEKAICKRDPLKCTQILKKYTKPIKSKTIYGKFNSNTIHSIIYTLCLIKKHKNLMVPHQSYIEDKYINDKINNDSMTFYVSDEGYTMNSLLELYMDILYEIKPFIIIWNSPEIHHIDKNLDLYLTKIIKKGYGTAKRIIYIKLTLIMEGGSHANIILIDTKKRTIERFDPYGETPYLNSNEMDDYFEMSFKKMHPIEDFKYIRPRDYFGGVGFQIISDDSNIINRKLGDPLGYCLAWTLWYLEERLTNPDLEPSEIIKRGMQKINENNKQTKFIDFIRDYSKTLDDMKNDFMERVGISSDNIYNMILSEDNKEKLYKGMVEFCSGIF